MSAAADDPAGLLAQLVSQLIAEAEQSSSAAVSARHAMTGKLATAQEAGDAHAIPDAQAQDRHARMRAAEAARRLEGLRLVQKELASRKPGAGRHMPRAAREPVCDVAGRDTRPDPLGSCTAADLMAAVRAYRVWAGNPSFRKMARIADCGVGYSRLCTALSRDVLPRQEIIEAVIKGCGAPRTDVERFVTAWRQLAMGKPLPRSKRLSIVPAAANGTHQAAAQSGG